MIINAVTEWLLNVVGLGVALGVLAGGFMYLLNSPEKGKAILGRVLTGALLAAAGIVLLNAYLHALAGGNPVAIAVLAAVSLTAYIIRLSRQRTVAGAPNNRRRLPGR